MSVAATDQSLAKGPNCHQCRYFAITWEPQRPYACKAMGFKTRMMPSAEVLRADGRPCQSFESKASHSPGRMPQRV